jgi:chemotaxis protein histidine kinase CheA
MTRGQIRQVREGLAPTSSATPASTTAGQASAAPVAMPAKTAKSSDTPPPIPPDVPQRFLDLRRGPTGTERLHYRPALAARATLHHAQARLGVDEWSRAGLVRPLDGAPGARPWDEATDFDPEAWTWSTEPAAGASFGELPKPARDPKRYKTWERMLKSDLYSRRPLRLYQCKALKLSSEPGESEADFRARMRDRVREERDLSLEKLRTKMAPKVARLEERIRTAERAVDRERSQHRQKKTDAAVTVGASLLGALFGRKLASATNVGRASSAAKAAGRVSREKEDIERAEEKLETLQSQLQEMERELQERLEEIRSEVTLDAFEVSEVTVAPRKSDLQVEELVLLWRPYVVDQHGIAHEAW